MGHRTVPHTADLIVEAWAPSREECLAEAVSGVVEGCVDTTGAVPVERRPFLLEAGSDEQVLVALLEEVVYVLDAFGEVPVATHLDPGLGSGWFDVVGLEALPETGSAPKGVARSGLVLDHDAEGWRCRVTVDV